MIHRYIYLILAFCCTLHSAALAQSSPLPIDTLIDWIRNDEYTRFKEALKAGVNPNTADQRGASLLMWACLYADGDYKYVEALLNAKADLAPKGLLSTEWRYQKYNCGGVLHVCAAVNDVTLLRAFIERYHLSPDTPAWDTLQHQHTGDTPLQIAATHGSVAVYEYLRKQTKSYAQQAGRALLLAMAAKQHDFAWRLIRQGVRQPPSPAKRTNALHYAVALNDTLLIQHFLDQGYNLNQVNEDGESPIFFTMRSEILQYLIKRGADPNIRNREGKNPAQIAEERGYLDATIYLLKNPHKPLHYAVHVKDYGAIYRAYKRGANLSEPDADGKTPLDIARSLQPRDEALELLLGQPEKIPLAQPKPRKGTHMTWAVDYDGRKYDFEVDVVELRPHLIVKWRTESYAGMMTITERALLTAEWQKNYFRSGDTDILLQDATSIWVSDAVFANLKAGKVSQMAGDNQINDIYPIGITYLPVRLNGAWRLLEVIRAASKDYLEEYYILNNDLHPIIMKMSFGWNLQIKEIIE